MSDASSDHIISWTADGRTFTVWQPDLMEQEQLPNTFKHSNFASFVRQLNNYGFRKCHSDRFEFGVEGFEKGKPELLTTLKRHDAPRSKKNQNAKNEKGGGGKSRGPASGGAALGAAGMTPDGANGAPAGSRTHNPRVREGSPGGGAQSLELGAYGGVTSEIEQLKRDRLLLLKEVMRLREEQSGVADEVRRLSARLQSTEQFQSRMVRFVEQAQAAGGNLASVSFDDIAGAISAASRGDDAFSINAGVGVPRKRRQMYLPAIGDAGLTAGLGGGGVPGGGDVEMRPGPARFGGVGVGAPRGFEEISDDALAHQMLGPLSPNPGAAIQLPEHEEWLDDLAQAQLEANVYGNYGAGTGGRARSGVVGESPLIRSMSQAEVADAAATVGMGRSGDDANADANANAPIPANDAFVSSILERGPSLEKQLSLGFLDTMSSAEIGEMVREMQIGQHHQGDAGERGIPGGGIGDDLSARFDALNG